MKKRLNKPALFGLGMALLLGTSATLQAASIGPYIGAAAAHAEDEVLNEGQSGFKAFIGANLTPYFGMELAYVDLGTYANGNLSQDGISYEVIGYIPLNRQMDLFGRAGFFDWEVSDNFTTVNGTDPTFGIGINLRLNPHASLRGEWQTFIDVDGGDVDLYSAGLSFNF